MNKNDFFQCIEEICPLTLAEEWDNCGIQVNVNSQEVNCCLVALEITQEVIDEAVSMDADMIITHHPLIFGEIDKVDFNTITGKYLIRLIQEEISVYSCHTSFDKVEGGNNTYLGQIMELRNVGHFRNNNAFCCQGETPFEVTFTEIIHRLSDELEVPEKYFSAVGDLTKNIIHIGWCTGSGSEFISEAVEEGYDLFITGDVKYHDAQFAKESGLCVLDIGHWGSEKIFVENMANQLRELTQCKIIESDVDINPFI